MTSTVYEFDGDAGNPLSYLWRGKLNLLPRTGAFTFCQVEAESFGDITIRVYGDGTLIHQAAVTSEEPFTLPLGNEYRSFEAELVGTSRVYTVRFGESVEELQ